MAGTRYISRVRKDTKDKKDYSDMSVIIPAAGMGRRMKTYGPKCMIPINGVPIIERQIKQLNKVYPNCDIIIVVGFGSSVISDTINSSTKHEFSPFPQKAI